MTDDQGDGGDAVLVHRLAGEQALAHGHRLLDPTELAASCATAGVDPERAVAALLALQDRRLVDVRTVGPALVSQVRLTEDGFVRYLTATRGDLEAVRSRVSATLCAEMEAGRLGAAIDLAGMVGEPALVVGVLLDRMRHRGEVVFTPVTGHRVRVHRIGPPPDRPLRAP